MQCQPYVSEARNPQPQLSDVLLVGSYLDHNQVQDATAQLLTQVCYTVETKPTIASFRRGIKSQDCSISMEELACKNTLNLSLLDV